jgi:hypothetical protein
LGRVFGRGCGCGEQDEDTGCQVAPLHALPFNGVASEAASGIFSLQSELSLAELQQGSRD